MSDEQSVRMVRLPLQRHQECAACGFQLRYGNVDEAYAMTIGWQTRWYCDVCAEAQDPLWT